MKRPKGFALKVIACREVIARCEYDLGRQQTDLVADLFCDQGVANSFEQAIQIKAVIFHERAMRPAGTPPLGTLKFRYPGGDPENGRAYKQRWNGKQWLCAQHDFRDYECEDLDNDGRPNGRMYTVRACAHCNMPG